MTSVARWVAVRDGRPSRRPIRYVNPDVAKLAATTGITATGHCIDRFAERGAHCDRSVAVRLIDQVLARAHVSVKRPGWVAGNEVAIGWATVTTRRTELAFPLALTARGEVVAVTCLSAETAAGDRHAKRRGARRQLAPSRVPRFSTTR